MHWSCPRSRPSRQVDGGKRTAAGCIESKGENMVQKPLLAAMLAAGMLCACGGDSARKSAAPSRVDVTIGQQLIELKEAHEAGALTDKEYDKQRKKLIDSVQ